jgi:hypothetical protein
VLVKEVFRADVIAMAPRAVPPPTAPVNAMSPVPAIRVSALDVPASESIAPKVMLPLVVVSVTSAVRIVFPFKFKSPPGVVIGAPILICPLPEVLSVRCPVDVLEIAPLITIFPPDAEVIVRLLGEFHLAPSA